MTTVRPLMNRGCTVFYPINQIPKADPILANKKRGTKCINLRKTKRNNLSQNEPPKTNYE